jgi:transposase-like protein
LESGERSAVQLGRELGVSDCSLGKWKRQYGRQGARSGVGAAQALAKSLYLSSSSSFVLDEAAFSATKRVRFTE